MVVLVVLGYSFCALCVVGFVGCHFLVCQKKRRAEENKVELYFKISPRQRHAPPQGQVLHTCPGKALAASNEKANGKGACRRLTGRAANLGRNGERTSPSSGQAREIDGPFNQNATLPWSIVDVQIKTRQTNDQRIEVVIQPAFFYRPLRCDSLSFSAYARARFNRLIRRINHTIESAYQPVSTTVSPCTDPLCTQRRECPGTTRPLPLQTATGPLGCIKHEG